MFRDEVIEFAETLPGTSHDCPFEDDCETTVLRHVQSGKWFGILLHVSFRKVGIERDGLTWILDLKCDPDDSFTLREIYKSIIPAYHMNKTHWITVISSGDVPQKTVNWLIERSFVLTDKRKH